MNSLDQLLTKASVHVIPVYGQHDVNLRKRCG